MASQNGETASKSIIPSWVKADLFEDVLKKALPDYVSIKSFKAKVGTTAGENYATVMLRLDIEANLKDGKSKAVSFMLKVPHDSEMFREILKKQNIFVVERHMYTDIVPEFQKLYADVGLDIKFGAEFYKMNAPDEYVLLEDLSNKGFKNANRLKGLDGAHVHCVLKKLAQWHAASAVRVATKGPYPKNMVEGFFKEENKQMIEEMGKVISTSFLKCLPTYNGHEAYLDQVIKLQEKMTENLIKVSKVNLNEFNVLNHGDCWANNIMFQYDAFGKIKETYFVDYQVPRYCTPAHDLLYFLLSSVNLEDKLSKFDANVKYYHDNLVEHLKLLKYPKTIPSLADIHIALVKYGVFGYTVATGIMSIVVLDPTDTASIENFFSDSAEGDKFKMLMYSNQRFRKHIEVVLPWLLNRGALEC